MNRLEHGLGSEVALLSLEDVDVVADDLLVLSRRNTIVVGLGQNSVHQVEQFSESSFHFGSVNGAQLLGQNFIEETGGLVQLSGGTGSIDVEGRRGHVLQEGGDDVGGVEVLDDDGQTEQAVVHLLLEEFVATQLSNWNVGETREHFLGLGVGSEHPKIRNNLLKF